MQHTCHSGRPCSTWCPLVGHAAHGVSVVGHEAHSVTLVGHAAHSVTLVGRAVHGVLLYAMQHTMSL